ncbi:diguanylate cyclase [Alphaproteobacteria bacterium]|nr:diguanylate cyclase [Alphaproteobacteria bacterium]
MDTVLIGGIGFLILAGISFLLIRKVDNSSMTDKNKRLFNYIILGMLILVTIAIFKWHSSTYLIPK